LGERRRAEGKISRFLFRSVRISTTRFILREGGGRFVTHYFSQRNKTLEIIYLNKEKYVHYIHAAAYFIVWCSALVFYFEARNRSKFKFDLNSNEFANSIMF
jgi:hypothetical protein